MNDLLPNAPISPLRQRLIDDMNVRRFSPETQRNYIRDGGRFATFLGRPPDTATAEDLRRFQVGQREAGVPVPTMNSIVSAQRFFFTHTLDRPDLARRLVRMTHSRKLPVVLSPDEVARLLSATTCLKHQAALSVAYGARPAHQSLFNRRLEASVVVGYAQPSRFHPRPRNDRSSPQPLISDMRITSRHSWEFAPSAALSGRWDNPRVC